MTDRYGNIRLRLNYFIVSGVCFSCVIYVKLVVHYFMNVKQDIKLSRIQSEVMIIGNRKNKKHKGKTSPKRIQFQSKNQKMPG